MTAAYDKAGGSCLPIPQGVLPIKGSQISTELIAGITLAAMVRNRYGYHKDP